MRRLPPLNSLKAFEAVARLGSALRAAEELCVSHGAVSKQIAVLEQWLGVPVFERQARGMTLNRDGLELLREVQVALDRIALGVRNVTERRSLSGLVVSAPPAMAMYWLLPRLTSFMVENPTVRIQITNRRADGAGMPEGVDVLVRRGEVTDPSLRQKRFMSGIVSPVCSPSLLPPGQALSLPDLARMTWLIADMQPQDWPNWLAFAQAEQVTAQAQLHFDHTYLALEAARDGLGVAMGALHLIQEDLALKKLVPLFPHLVMPSSPYVVAYQAGRQQEPALAAFESWLVAEGRSHERATRRMRRAWST